MLLPRYARPIIEPKHMGQHRRCAPCQPPNANVFVVQHLTDDQRLVLEAQRTGSKRILEQLDVEGSREKVKLFPLQHASALVLSEQITRILMDNQVPTASATRMKMSRFWVLGA